MAGAPVAFAGTMPAEEVNGAIRWAAQLIEQAKAGGVPTLLVVGVVDVTTLRIKPRTGEETPVLGFRHLEVVAPESERGKQLRELLGAEHQARTGHLQLPFEPGAVIPVPDPFPEDDKVNA